MKKKYLKFSNIFILSFCFAFIVIANIQAQTRVGLQDNMVLQSNSSVKIIPDNYQVRDGDGNGIIQIINKNNIIIDGDSVNVDGETFTGYLFYIENSDHITIKNFSSVKDFYYVALIKNSSNITVTGNNFSFNKIEHQGWLHVWTDWGQEERGGGVVMDSCTNSTFSSNIMQNQNDGVALYHCKNITMYDNNLSWNTAYGIRMFFTDSCYIHDNNCSHANRWTDPSDCAAILLIISNHNKVTHNDITYSGDGIFLGQYQYSQIKNDNYFAYNDGSYSPHNAFEATFADGNVFVHNKANNSDYGFWLGYSYNTRCDSNEINNNQTAGIAVDRGFNNHFTGDTVNSNPIGVQLWEGNPISPYQDQGSHDYLIKECVFNSDRNAVTASQTESLVIKNSIFDYNYNGVEMDGTSYSDTLTGNSFSNSIMYHIQNNSTNNIDALNNKFGVDDTSLIEDKIYDKKDDPSKGSVLWMPFIGGAVPQIQLTPPADLAEPPSMWTVYPADGRLTTATWDSTEKKYGSASLKIFTKSGFDVMINYWPGSGKIAKWDLSKYSELHVWIKAFNANNGLFQNNSIRIGNNSGGYFNYTAPSSELSSAVGQWKEFTIPLAGNSTWQRTIIGNVSLSNISYVQIHADTWDFGFILYIDGLSFTNPTDVNEKKQIPLSFSLKQNYPNPFNPSTTIEYTIPDVSAGNMVPVHLTIYDVIGNVVKDLVNGNKQPGNYKVEFDASHLSSGIYFYRLRAGKFLSTKKMILLK